MKTGIKWATYPSRITLSELTTIEFAGDLPPTDNVRALLRAARGHPTVKVIKRKIECGQITEAQIESFVDEILKEGFQNGVRFSYEHTLIALASIMMERDTPFAKRYLSELADLGRSCEFVTSGRAAAEALREMQR